MVIFRSKWLARRRKTEEKRRYVRFFRPKYHSPTVSNYRSHPPIINVCNQWMTSFNWSNPGEASLRTEKTIRIVPGRKYPDYPAVLTIQAVDIHGEAEQFAELVYSLKQQGRISDYSHVALLLHSVRPHISKAYRDALAKKEIPAYCPRARTYFDQEEISLMVGCLARIFRYQAEKQARVVEDSYFPPYLKDCKVLLAKQCQLFPVLEEELQAIEQEMLSAEEERGSDSGQQLADYFYRLIFSEPYITFLTCESKRHNLVMFSQVLRTFQKYHRYTSVTQNNLERIASDFFHRFLCLLYVDGINLDEDQQQPFPKGHVQIMTIHQAKGLEFPVVVVGRLDKPLWSSANVDKALQRFYHHSSFEPAKLVPDFDFRRLYYVASSRAEKLLVLAASKKPDSHFATLWQDLPSWPDMRESLLEMQKQPLAPKQYVLLKPRYGFTSHVRMYTTCPRQFQFFQQYQFAPSRSLENFFGLLVHQTLEGMHRRILEGKLDTLDEKQVRAIFENTFKFLMCTNMHPINDHEKEQAFCQVLNYFHGNQQELRWLEGTELSFRVENDGYILTGKIDLLLKRRNGLEILDFKTRARPENGSAHLAFYKQQLCLYAYALQKRTGLFPSRLLIYWTAEESKEDALMEIPYQEEDVKQVVCYLDEIAAKIQQQQFAVITPPEPEVCKMCDVRHLCRKEGIIS